MKDLLDIFVTQKEKQDCVQQEKASARCSEKNDINVTLMC